MLSAIFRRWSTAGTHREAFRRGYKKGKDLAATEATAREKELEVAIAQAFDDEKKRGYAEGHRQGKQDGKGKGMGEGKLMGFNFVANDIGRYRVVASLEDIPNLFDDSEPPRPNEPNVYDTGISFVARTLVGGVRHRVEHPDDRDRSTKRYKPPVEAYVRSVLFRDAHLPSGVYNNCAHYREMFDEAREGMADLAEVENTDCWQDPSYIRVRVALEFHRRLLVRESPLGVTGWLGDDPGDRFHLDDTTILGRPWTALHHKWPSNYQQALIRNGLGDMNNPRTVRDLLLVTADELTEVPGFGPGSLRVFRRLVESWGLALWGDAVPAPQPHRLHDPQHNMRSIDLT